MKQLIVLLALGSSVVGCSSPAPDAVAKQYLEAGSRGDMDAARKLVADKCLDKDEGKVAAIRMMGVPITIQKLDVSVVSTKDDSATVRFEVSGSAKGSGETEVLGAKVKMDNVNVENASKNGELKLEKVDGKWKITCE